MADDLNVILKATDNVSAVVKKISANIQTLSNNFEDLAGALQDLTKLQRAYAESSGASVKSTQAVGKAAAQSLKQVNSLAAAFAQPGLKGFDGLQINFSKLSSGRIAELSERLREAGSSLSDFIQRGGRVDPKILSAPFQDALSNLNQLRSALGKPLAVVSDFSDIEEVFKETEVLARKMAQNIQKEISEALSSLGSKTAFSPIGDLQKTLSDLSKDSGIKNLDKIINFERTRDGAENLVVAVEDIENRMLKIGPAAQEGNAKAIKEFLELNTKLEQAQTLAKQLDQELRAAGSQFEKSVTGINEALGELNFREIRLDDIFPTREQRKVIELQQKIDNAVRQSVEEGAVRTSLNTFLQLRKPIESVDRNIVSLTSHLPRLRYALYDVSNTLSITGAAILGAAGATIKFAADFERSFADVKRTVDGTENQLKSLRKDIENLSQEIPVSFSELADIATLAGQLNVASEVVSDFTETVAKFAATTDVTTEAAATAFGRLDQLVEGVDGQFEKLGSSILKVGVNAVATESDIIAIANQIASVANIAGFSASELIGFSSALASVGTRPELSRGTFTRLFTEIQQAVGEGGEKLDAFAKTAGQSSQQFKRAWGEGSGSDQVIAILKGLNEAGTDADRVLAQLGITSVRDVPTMLKLAQSVEEVERQIRVANVGFLEGTELTKQYDVITSTLSEKLKILKNNFQVLMVTLSGFSESFSFVIDLAIAFLKVVERILDNPFSKFFLTIGTVLTGLVGILALVGAAATRFAGSFAGLLTTSIETTEALAFTRIAVSSLGTQMDATTASTVRATTAMNGYNVATTSAGASNVAAGSSGLILVESFKKNKAEGSKLGGVMGKLTKIPLAKTFSAIGKQTKLLSFLRLGALVTGWGIAANVAFFAFDALGKKFGWFGDETEKTTNKIDNFGAYLQAAAKDTEDFKNSTDSAAQDFIVLDGAIAETGDELSDYVKLVLTTNGELGQMGEYVDAVADAFGRQTIAIGENTKALIRQDLASSIIAAGQQTGLTAIKDSLIGAFTGDELSGEMVRQNVGVGVVSQLLVDTDASELLKQYGFDYQQYVKAVEEGNLELVESITNKLGPALTEVSNNLDPAFLEKYGISAFEMQRAIDYAGAGFLRLGDSGLLAQEALKESRIEAILSGEAFETAGEDISTSAEDMGDAFKAIIEGAFGASNAQNNLNDSLSSLGSVLANEGAQAAASSKELQSVLQNIWDTSDDGYDAALNMAGFFNALVDGGYASADQLGELQDSIVSTFNTFAQAQIASLKLAADSFSALEKARSTALGSDRKFYNMGLDRSNKAIDEIARIEAAVDDFGNISDLANDFDLTPLEKGFTKVANSASNFASKTAEAVDQVKEEVRTLLDYAGDLENVFSRAFDIRFGALSGIDAIAAAWESFTDNVNDAKNAVQELKDTQDDLAADVAIKEYFLSVAEAYDDQLRAAKLRTEIADIEKQQADAAKALADAQAQSEGATGLTGQSEQGRQNRGALLGLVKNYQDYITVLAESGASQDELRKATERARKEFIAQATELGFAESEVMMYAEAFDDVRVAIDNVPRNITVQANVNPALQALNELNASLQTQIDKANELNRALNQPVSTPTPTRPIIPSGPTQAGIVTERRAQGTAAIGNPENVNFNNPNRITISRVGNVIVRSARDTSGSTTYNPGGYSSGGYTGPGGKMQPAGIVHKGEYVVPQKYVNQSTGLPDANFLSQLQNGVRGYAQGGFVGGGGMGDGTMMVELSPYDRKLLADAGNVQLRVDGKVVASATNRSNFNEARRGSN